MSSSASSSVTTAIGRQRRLASTSPTWRKTQPLIERIAERIDPANVKQLEEEPGFTRWRWNNAYNETLRLIGILEKQEALQRIMGPEGPKLAAYRLHPWVWNAATSLWGGGHHGPALHEAAKAVELQTQLKVGRRDLTGRKLYSTAFSKDDPSAGGARLRFAHLDRSERPDDWNSAHEGDDVSRDGLRAGHPQPPGASVR